MSESGERWIKWEKENPEKRKDSQEKYHRERHRKGGKYYEKYLKYRRIGLSGERSRIRSRDRRIWKPFKDIIAQETEVHHEWIPDTAEYNGIAIVDKSEHQNGLINPILILDGEIKLLEE